MRCFFTSLLFCATLNAADWYVATTGSDSSGTGLIGAPWRTISNGIFRMSAGDTLNVRGGTYQEGGIPPSTATIPSLPIFKSGPSASQPTKIRGYLGEAVVFRIANNARWAMFIGGSSSITRSNFWISDMRFDGTLSAGPNENGAILLQNTKNITVSNVWFEPWPAAVGVIHVATTDSLKILGCSFTNWGFANTATATRPVPNPLNCLYLHDINNTIIRSNIVENRMVTAPYRLSASALTFGRLTGWGTNNLVEANRFYVAAGYGIYADGQTAGLVMRNNVIVCTSTERIALATGSGTAGALFDNNTIYGGKYGIYFTQYSPVSQSVFRNNIVWGQALVSIDTDAAAVQPTYWTNNIAVNIVDNGHAMVIHQSNLIGPGFNPQFISAPNNLMIQTNGSAWQTGLSLPGLVVYDILGTARGPNWDIGAYQIDFGDPEVEPPGTPPVHVIADGPFARRQELVPQTFTFSRTSAVGAVTAHFNITGTAVANTDYVAFANEVTFGAGVTNVVATVTPLEGGSAQDVTVIVTLIDDPVDPDTYTKQDPITATITIRSVPAEGSGYRPPPGHRAYKSIL